MDTAVKNVKSSNQMVQPFVEGGGNDEANQVWGDGGVLTNLPYEAPARARQTPNWDGPHADDPDNILDRLAVLDAAVRDALPQLRCRAVRGATLRKVHDAALGVIGAARQPTDLEERADPDADYVDMLGEHVFDAIDRLDTKS